MRVVHASLPKRRCSTAGMPELAGSLSPAPALGCWKAHQRRYPDDGRFLLAVHRRQRPHQRQAVHAVLLPLDRANACTRGFRLGRSHGAVSSRAVRLSSPYLSKKHVATMLACHLM